MLNKIILIGRLVREPELRYTPSGVAVARFTIAVDRPFANRQGERETDFIDIVVWQKQAEICTQYLGKGRLVAVEGRLQIRSYDDSQGVRRKAAEVVAEQVRFLDRPREGQATIGAGSNDIALAESGYSEVNFSEDDIPF
ncbi:single-strand DNA-binding protein [Desulfofundulus luciae]|uniref:Single-stranded DNA-binding protein n=1 Tax=Desulfofundulus luciae TaxID=74702 RepID=A0ABU0AWT2_9FIRM|nr:single-stranded DNA-binding protein [Desulfofundulus luciae]MDQ0284937.1 single-strand DNA-binding protein [Desulfofundulus luciae]